MGPSGSHSKHGRPTHAPRAKRRGPKRRNITTKRHGRACTPAWWRWHGGEGLSRSRGGLTSKLHLSADGRCRPLSMVVTGGQRAGHTQLQAVLEKIRVPRLGPGKPRDKPDSFAADKAYSNGPCRTYLQRRGIQHTHPGEVRQPGRASAKGIMRLTAPRLRRRAVQEAQYRGTGDQPTQAVPISRYSV
ncbi:transposase [Streptomyces sp. NPDC050610]|uniref:transposase n=1 Tax=Streptomyces sp. NPDC050610 TaxID=3157097 RepID=UPI003441B9A2